MIKYLGSKRRLVPALGELCARAGARTALDLFTGTTRVAQEFKRRGARVWAVDTARYSQALAGCYVATDARRVDEAALAAALARLDALPGREGSHIAHAAHVALVSTGVLITTISQEQSRFWQRKT